MSFLLARLRRQARLPEFRLLLLGLAFISMALSAVGLFGSRVELAMQAQGGALFGADGALLSSRPIDDQYEQIARRFGLSTVRTVSFLSMVVGPSGSRLARVMAAAAEHPLRGEIVTRAVGAGGPGDGGARIERGTAWVAPPLIQELELEAGSTLELGRAAFRVSREILLEPEGTMASFRIAPRVQIHLEDLESTQLVTPASRARFALLVAGEETAVKAFAREIESTLASYQSWRAADLSSDELDSTVGRVVSYLKLAVLLSVVLAVVAMALAAQGLWRREVYAGALSRCLGASHARAVRAQALSYLASSVPVSAAGVLAGALLQWIAGAAVHRATGIELPAADAAPAVVAGIISVVTMLAVMLPLLLAQRRVPVMVLLRSEQRDRMHSGVIGALSVAALVILFALLLAGDVRLAGSVLAGLLAAGILFWVLIRLLLGALGAATPVRASVWYVGLKSLLSNARRSAWLASAFGVTVFALVLLGVVRDDLFDAWDRSIPVDAPNTFLVNIQPDEVDALRSALEAQGIAAERFYPIFRGRLAAIEGEAVSAEDYDGERARHRINHEFNLTEDAELPEDNEIVAGTPFGDGQRGFSVEEETARSLNIGIGTRITFDIGGNRVEAPVVNIRSVRWDSMKPNFFVLASPELFGDAPRNYITAARVEDDIGGFSRYVNERFPAVTVIDLDMIFKRLRHLVAQAGAAVSAVFVFTLGAAFLVLLGVLQGQRAARRREIALLKTLGADRRRIRAIVLVEFALLGAAAGLVGGGLALASGWLLAAHVFEFAYTPDWRWLAASSAAGAAAVGAAGYLAIRPLLRVRPVQLLAT